MKKREPLDANFHQHVPSPPFSFAVVARVLCVLFYHDDVPGTMTQVPPSLFITTSVFKASMVGVCSIVCFLEHRPLKRIF